jgi:PKD repeat protein
MKILLRFVFIFISTLSLAQPTANFTISSPIACVGETVTVTSTSTANGSPIVNYIWSAQGAVVEQSQGANMTSFSFVYNNPGIYNLSLIVQDANGEASNSFQNNAIEIFENPISQFNFSVLTCQEPFQVNFNSAGSSTGTNISYAWQFPGANPLNSSSTSQLVSFPGEGSYQVSLRVTNQQSTCFTDSIVTLDFEAYITDFSLPTSACKNTAFSLQDQSSIGVNNWSWSSSSGVLAGASSSSPSLTISEVGTHTITLISSNTLSACKDTIVKEIVIHDLPVVSYSSNINFGCAPKNVILSNTSPITTGVTFTWDFDDGSPNFIGQSPAGHIYTQNNRMYFPKLTAIDQNGCSNFFIGDTIFFFPPEAAFSFNEADGCAPKSVQFTDQSYAPSGETIVSWKWDFDDGSISSQQNPNHSFECGFYDVRLIIQTASGCIDTTYLSDAPINTSGGGYTTVSDNINVVQLNDSLTIFRNHTDILTNNFIYRTIRFGTQFSTDFTYTPSVLCSNEPVMLQGLNPPCPIDPMEPNDIQYQWSFEGFGGMTSPTPQATRIFFDTLRTDTPMDIGLMIDFRGCVSDETVKTDVLYLKGPVSRFQANALFCNEGPGPHSVAIKDSLSIYGHISDYFFEGNQVAEDQSDDDVEVKYVWGDGTEILITDDAVLEDLDKGSTNHIFNGFGTYIIKQVITNHTTGCADSSERTIFVTEINTSLFTDTVCKLELYKLDIQTNTPSVHFPITYSVLDGTQTTSSSTMSEFVSLPFDPLNFQHATAGEKQVEIVVSNILGCTDTLRQTLTVLELPEAIISVEEDSICINTNVVFSGINSVLGDFPSWNQFYWNINNGQTILTSSNIDTITFLATANLNIRLSVEDQYGCISNNLEFINIFTQSPSANFTTNEYLCNDVNELLDASISSGVEPLNYTWYLDGVAIDNSNTDSLYNTLIVSPPDALIANHTYSLLVTDNKNCKDSISKAVLVSNPRITSVNTDITATYVDVNGNFTCPPVYIDFDLTYQTNFEASNYAWSLGNDFDTDFDSYNANPQGIQYVEAGSYDLYVQMTESVTGCVFSYSDAPFLTIGGPKAEILITTDPDNLCGMTYIFQLIDPSDNLHHWSWDLGDGTIQTSENNPDNIFTHTYLDVNDFSPVITLYDDSSLCTIPITKQIDAFANGLNAFFEMNPENALVDLNMQFDDLSTSSNSTIVSWLWDFGDGDSLLNNSSISVYHTYVTEGNVEVILTITDEFGCTDQYKLPIYLYDVNFAIPNIVTNPSGNGQNSLFTLFEDIFEDFELVVVNRWGNVVQKSTKDPLNPVYLWDGRDYRSGKLCSDGVYYYIIEGKMINGKMIKHQDFVTLAGGKF